MVKNLAKCRKQRRCGFDPWVRKIPQITAWQPTPVFLPRESHRQRSLAGYSPQGCKESDMMETTQNAFMDTCRSVALLECYASNQGPEWASQMVLVVKNLPANAGDMRDAGLILGLERSPGGGNATRSSILAWRIPWTEETGWLQFMESQRTGHD